MRRCVSYGSSYNSSHRPDLLTEDEAARATSEAMMDCFIVASWKYIQLEVKNGR
jgi:hypothetical protein